MIKELNDYSYYSSQKTEKGKGMAFIARRQNVVLLCLFLTVAQRVVGQSSIGLTLPCQAEGFDPDSNNPSDNLSCPNTDPTILECYSMAQLCDGVGDCDGGSDEGDDLVALDCGKYQIPYIAYILTPCSHSLQAYTAVGRIH